MTNHSFWFYWFVLFGVIFARYFLISGGTYLLFYSILGKSIAKRSLRLKPPLNRTIRSDIKLSIISGVIFALGAAFIVSEYNLGATLVYGDIDNYGLWYLAASFVAVMLIQDTYFYFIHKLFHHHLLFKWMHLGHHRSGEPTPWSSFAFDPPEAVIQALFFVSIVFIVPLHFVTLIALLMTMTMWAVLNHLGFELFPASFRSHWLGKWLIGSTHHSTHHRHYNLHYGLYFTFWDKLLGTEDPNYGNNVISET